jgi:two-component system cell cycle response regulator DivK
MEIIRGGIMDHKPSVLVADGTEACSYISIVLNRMGFTVIPVLNGQDALDMASSISPDVAIIDANLPGENGMAVVRGIRSDRFISDTRIIMTSTGSIDELKKECQGLECDAHLEKPIDIMKLHTEIQQIVSFPGGNKRRYVRVAWISKISLDYSGYACQYDTVSISEGGMYIKAVNCAPQGTAVSGTLPVNDSKLLDFKGSVIYTRGESKQFPQIIPGMAIAFDGLSHNDMRFLRNHIVTLLTLGVFGIEDHITFL